MLYSTKTLHSIYKRVHFLSSKYQKLVRVMIFSINLVLHLFASSQLVSLAEWVWQHYDDLISRISAYHMQLCTFSILQDTNSQDWSNSKPFYEVNQYIIIILIMLIIPLLYHQGKRISFHIQM